MLAVPTALLLHTTAAGDHHDWLLGDPARWPTAGARLWTARVQPGSWAWAAVGRFELTPLPPHRPRYLWYEGPISGDRGQVRRVDAGYALVLRWRGEAWREVTGTGGERPVAENAAVVAGILAVRMAHFRGLVELVRVDTGRWEARVKG